MGKLFYLFCIFILVGCGYKPVTHYAKEEIKGSVYVALDINIESSRDSVLLKDTMNRLIVGNLDVNLVKNKELADTKIYLSLPQVSHTPLFSDQEGYTSKYRTKVQIAVKYEKKDGIKRSFSISDYSDYTVANDAQLSDQRRKKAISEATQRALKNVFTQIALKNIKEK